MLSDDLECSDVAAKTACEGYTRCEWHSLYEKCESADAADDTIPCTDYYAKGSCENLTYCAWHTLYSKCESADAADDTLPCSYYPAKAGCENVTYCAWDTRESVCEDEADVNDDDYDDVQKESCSLLTYEGRCLESTSCEWDTMLLKCLNKAITAADADPLSSEYSPLMDHATVLYSGNLDVMAKARYDPGRDDVVHQETPPLHHSDM